MRQPSSHFVFGSFVFRTLDAIAIYSASCLNNQTSYNPVILGMASELLGCDTGCVG